MPRSWPPDPERGGVDVREPPALRVRRAPLGPGAAGAPGEGEQREAQGPGPPAAEPARGLAHRGPAWQENEVGRGLSALSTFKVCTVAK